MGDELLQLVDREGNPLGRALRSECHGNPHLIQEVVHLHLFDRSGRMYLQKRGADKDRFPGRWDTSVGGHVSPGESPDQAILREAAEELGLDLEDTGDPAGLTRLEPYIYGDEIETEYVVPYRLVYSGSLDPNPEEVEAGGFFELDEISRRLRESPEEFTPHFRLAFERLLARG
jgi:isopentenyldiphosphate isomerase